MNPYEIARRASALPEQFATRLPEKTLAGLRLMEEGGEYGELAIELTATLVKTGAAVSAAERHELRALLEATGMPTHLLEQLAVRD
ncbi:MAG TPA: hypothetical protein VF940_31595 [Streptosporangiaceae bacterium]